MLTKIRKCTAAKSAANSGGLDELATEKRERNRASTGKNARYASTHQVAARCESSAGRPCHQRWPLKSTTSGAAKLVMTSSFPVLTSVTVEVSTSSESEVRKKRPAGRAESPGVAMEAAMTDFFIVAPAGRGRNEAGRKDNSQRLAGAEAAAARAARAARATLCVRLDTGRAEISFNCTRSEPLIRGSLFTRMRDGLMVMSRYVTV